MCGANAQIAVSILHILGLDPVQLDAVKIEGTIGLPGLSLPLVG